MKLLRPDLEPQQGELHGDEQLSPAYWEAHQKPANPLRSTLRWVGKLCRWMFEDMPRLFELSTHIKEQAIALWDKRHKIKVPPQLPDTVMGFAYVEDYWLEMGDPCA